MSRVSVITSLESKMLEALRALNPGVQVVGLMEVASEGVQKEQDLTSLQVRVYGLAQINEAQGLYTATAEVRLNVEQAESANGALFLSAYEAVEIWLEEIMLGGDCTALDTDRAYVDGLQATGGDKDFDTTSDTWFAVWTMTLTGRMKPLQDEEETQETQEVNNG